MNGELIKLAFQLGGFVVVSVFAFIMLKSQLSALKDFNRTLSNHFRADQEILNKVNESLINICNELKELRKEK